MYAEYLSTDLNVRENWKGLHEDGDVMLKWIREGMVFKCGLE